ncbi:hypothetical protein [Sphaerisporangium dianthi]|uniref:Uncharacterized protein n=1 Tax=Sphaerisporangium dianthi TaxID=1436120 RepID=A0ABV9CK17_9ACTN
MVDEGLSQLAASVHRVSDAIDELTCRRRKGEQCRLAVWGLVLVAFVVACVTPVAAKAQALAATAATADHTSAICAAGQDNKLFPCPLPQHSPRRW